jgi:hypothetical protein
MTIDPETPPVTRIAALLLAATTLAGCTAGRNLSFDRPTELPGITVEASLQVVRDVITDSAQQRGSAVALVGDGLVLQRPLGQSSPDVEAACGPHRPGRNVRIVLRTRAIGSTRTQLSEERYVVDSGGRTCPVPLLREDLAQSRAALARIKAQSEAVQTRIRTAEAAIR